MSVEQKPPLHPLFVGTMREVGDRILSTPLDALLEATLAEPNTWGVLILRIFMEQTPITEVVKGETPIGLHIRNALLFEKYCSTFFECAFRIYGADVWGVITGECNRIAENNVYPQLLTSRLRDILSYQGEAMSSFIDWSFVHPEEARLIRLLAAISMHGKWDRSAHALICARNEHAHASNELMRTARELMCEQQKLFSLELLVKLANDTSTLPELRAAAFAVLYDNNEGAGAYRELIALSLPSFIAYPGNATALHAIAWRTSSILPEAAIPLIGRQLRNMNADLFRPHGNFEWRSYNDRCMLRDTAIWQYFYNMPMTLFVDMLEREYLSFPEALAALVRLADKSVHTAPGGLFYAAEARTFEFVNNPEYLTRLMLMFSEDHVAGRPEWNRVKWALQHFPAEVQRTCVEIAHRINNRERDETYPSASQLVRFIKTAWSGESRFNKYSFFRKQLVEIRNVLDMYGHYPKAVAELTAFIAERGIRDIKKK